MLNHKANATVIITNSELEQGHRVGILKEDGRNTVLFQDEDKGLVFYRGGKENYFMQMIEEDDYNKVINAMLDVSFTPIETKTIEVRIV
ncbi:hypothetical protein ACE3L8_12070 [Staphylococcus simulans]|uniref:hypothetical protein n=1 Tax=Staphylococcus simulans TaxID=1286 RepID=UPI003665E2F5